MRDANRYVIVRCDGKAHLYRDQVALQAEVVSLLHRDGAVPKKRIIIALGTTQGAIETALAALLDAGTIEHYRARSTRGRMDEFWCVAGRAPQRAVGSVFRSEQILAAFQSNARRQLEVANGNV